MLHPQLYFILRNFLCACFASLPCFARVRLRFRSHALRDIGVSLLALFHIKLSLFCARMKWIEK
jgi:hypothetical protein